MSRQPRLDTRRQERPDPVLAVDEKIVPSPGPGPRRTRALVFVVLCAVSVLVAGGYAVFAARRDASSAHHSSAEPAADAATLARLSAAPHLVFLDSDGDAYRRVALAPLDGSDTPRQFTALRCQRVHFAAGRGLCLGQDPFRGGAFIFDADFQVRHTLPASGLPSRTRVSPDGRYGTMTVFVQGHSYAEGGFSTKTTLVDMATGSVLADLENFAVWKDEARFRAVDFNFWGVTFARDSNRFYATLASGGKTYLLEGDIAARQARVLRENAECPSLSPDNTRLVFKKQMQGKGQRVVWQLHLLDLATMTERPLAETRNVDDQVEWLDEHQILYVLPDAGPPATIRPDTWALQVDDGSAPRLLATRSFSPTVVR
jgi:hypothetical protein